MRRYATASALAIVAMAGQAWAEVTPQQVWDDFEAYINGFGYQLTATETMEGSSLVVSDMTMVVTIPEESEQVRVLLPPMTFAEAGEGGVSITYPETSQIEVYVVEGDETVGEIIVDMTQSAFEMLVTGNPGDMTYAYSGDSITLELARVYGYEDDEEIGRDVISASMTMGPLVGTSHIVKSDGLRSMEQDVSLGTLTFDMMGRDPDSDEGGMISTRLTGVKSAGTTVLPEVIDYEDPTSMFRNGGSVDTMLMHTGGATEFTFDEGDGPVVGAFSSTGGEFRIAMSETDLSYGIKALGQTVDLTGPEIPLPVKAALGELGLSLDMPLAPSDAPVPASVSVRMGDFTMDDMLWNIFDPAQMLPRDPATVAVDLSAMVTPFLSLMDADAMENLGATGGVPGELNSVTLNELVVDMLGASILGSGAFTFDNSDMQTFGGFPRPEGALNLTASGLNGLLDTAVSMGLLPEEEAGGFRMMMSMFTVPGSDPDTMTSTIEINEQGHVLANGQRIQ